MRDGDELGNDCGKKRAIRVANRCSIEFNVHQPSATAAVRDDTLLPFDLSSIGRKKLTIDFDSGNHSSNGGLLM